MYASAVRAGHRQASSSAGMGRSARGLLASITGCGSSTPSRRTAPIHRIRTSGDAAPSDDEILTRAWDDFPSCEEPRIVRWLDSRHVHVDVCGDAHLYERIATSPPRRPSAPLARAPSSDATAYVAAAASDYPLCEAPALAEFAAGEPGAWVDVCGVIRIYEPRDDGTVAESGDHAAHAATRGSRTGLRRGGGGRRVAGPVRACRDRSGGRAVGLPRRQDLVRSAERPGRRVALGLRPLPMVHARGGRHVPRRDGRLPATTHRAGPRCVATRARTRHTTRRTRPGAGFASGRRTVRLRVGSRSRAWLLPPRWHVPSVRPHTRRYPRPR